MKQSSSNISAYSLSTLMTLVVCLSAHVVVAKSSGSVGTVGRTRSSELTTPAQESEPGSVRDLKLREPIERELKGGEVHSYRMTLTAGQYVQVVVEQKGIDVVLRLFAPDGKQITEVRSATPPQAPDPLLAVADAGGEYRLEVKSVDNKAATGRYEIKLEELREATEKDRSRVHAERAFAEAEQLRTQATGQTLRKSINNYEEALSLWRTLGDRQGEALTLNMMSDVYQLLGENSKALDYQSQALSLSRAIGDRRAEGESLFKIGVVYWGIGNSQKALDYYDQALPIFRAAGDRRTEARTLGAMGVAYSYLGKLREAIDYNQQALVLHREVGNRLSEASTLNNIALPYFRMGEWQKALDYQNQALSLVRELGDRRSEAQFLTNIGFVNWQLGEDQKALDYYNQALPLRRVTADRNGEAYTLSSMGGVYQSLGDVQKALSYYDQALTLSRALGDRRGESNALLVIGIAYRSLGETEKALQFFDQALVLRHAEGDVWGEAGVLDRIGTAYSSLGKYEEAVRYLEQALALSRTIGARSDEAASLANLARAEQGQGQLAAAKTHMEAALSIVESIRSKFVGQQLRTSFSMGTRRYYDGYINLLMEMQQKEPLAGHDVTAFDASERARARSLLEMLAQTRVDIRQGVDGALLERQRSVQQQLNAKSEQLTRLLSAKPTEEQATARKKEVEDLLKEYEDVTAEISAKSPRYAALTQPQPLSLKEIQQLLDKETLLLEYALGEEKSYVWAVTPTSIKSFELPKRSEIEALAQGFYKSITSNENRAVESQLESATALSKVLLTPVTKELGQKQLFIVSDGALQYVPFAALPKPNLTEQSGVVSGGNKKATGKYQPLIVDHEIVQLPSASVLSALRHQTEGRLPAPNTVAVFADPVFQTDDPRIKRETSSTGAIPNQEMPQSSAAILQSDVKRSAWESGLQDLQRLPFTRREAESIVAVAPLNRSLKALDFDASLEMVKSKQITQYRIIHFATHGLLNSTHPELSGLVLSLVDKDGKSQDGFVRLNEIYNLNLPAELVVLSACQTALGKDIKGEGLVGLTRGFMYAGAKRVVVSLWDVKDAATAELMKRFYEGMLKKGMRPAAALRAAQVAMSKSLWWNAPYYWAGFVLQGDWR